MQDMNVDARCYCFGWGSHASTLRENALHCISRFISTYSCTSPMHVATRYVNNSDDDPEIMHFDIQKLNGFGL